MSVYIIGIGRLGSRLGEEISNTLKLRYDSIDESIIDGILSPAISELRYKINIIKNDIIEEIGEENVLLIGDLSEKISIASLPLLTYFLKEEGKEVYSIVTMPYRFENRLYEAKQALLHIHDYADCNIVIDKDALLQTNPDLTIEGCNNIIGRTIISISNIMLAKELEHKDNMLALSINPDIEIAFRDAIKMLYANHEPDEITDALIYVYGKDTKIGDINKIVKYANDTLSNASICVSLNENGNGIILLTKSDLKFEKYDPLSKIKHNIDPSIDNMLKIDLPLINMEL
ncbi:MAG: hypothetical protein KatS3mg003_0595 [Candidatus Nitrosocaldaceae archaeon]|nr:MAG: hypothetical protein KatS3mg003_0595 [Candidatus Nitrosocaldaceae archaeon]